MEVELATCRTSLLRARPRLDLVSILLDRRFLSSSRWVRYKNRSIHDQRDSSPIAGREVVRDVHGRPFVGYDVGGKAPQRRGQVPRTHSLQRQVRLITVPKRKLVRRRASAHQIFHNGPRRGGLYGDAGH